MKFSEFECQLRQYEMFHGLKVIPNTWMVIRVDGRKFSNYTLSFEKPFDNDFSEMMRATAQHLLEQFDATYVWTESDEISVLLNPNFNLFDREVEKLVSISAGEASAKFVSLAGDVVSFDSRIWVGLDKGHVVDYFRWRQADAFRCALNAWTFWTLMRKEHLSPAAAAHKMHNKGAEWNQEELFRLGINFEKDVPLWQKRGIGVVWENYAKLGINPITNEQVVSSRRRPKFITELPYKDQYDLFLYKTMADDAKRRGETKVSNRISMSSECSRRNAVPQKPEAKQEGANATTGSGNTVSIPAERRKPAKV